MISKEELIHSIEEAIKIEESAIPIYSKHIIGGWLGWGEANAIKTSLIRQFWRFVFFLV